MVSHDIVTDSEFNAHGQQQKIAAISTADGPHVVQQRLRYKQLHRHKQPTDVSIQDTAKALGNGKSRRYENFPNSSSYSYCAHVRVVSYDTQQQQGDRLRDVRRQTTLEAA